MVDLLSNVVAYDGTNEQVNFLLADAFEQLGYQEEVLYLETGLTSALELRKGGKLAQPVNTAGIDVLTALPSDVVITYIADLMDVEKSEQAGNIAFNLKLNGENFYLEAENGLLRSKKGVVKNDLTHRNR